MTSSRLRIQALAFCLSVVPASFAGAQQLPAGFEEQPSPNSATLSTFADAISEHLRSGDASRISQARERVLERLNNPAVSVGFRLGLTDQLTQDLREIASGDSGLAATNALRIAGEIGTSGSLEVVIESLENEQATIRYTAAVAAGATFDVANSTAPPLRERPVNTLIDALANRIETDADPEVIAASMRALLSARQVTRGPLVPQASRALVRLSESAGKRLSGLASADMTPEHERRLLVAVIGAGAGLRDQLADVGRQTPLDVRKAAAALAGDALGHVYGVVRTEGIPDNEDTRQLMIQLVDTAEKVIFFADDSSGSASSLAQTLRERNREGFIRGVVSLVGPGGRLSERPFGFAGDRFLADR